MYDAASTGIGGINVDPPVSGKLFCVLGSLEMSGEYQYFADLLQLVCQQLDLVQVQSGDLPVLLLINFDSLKSAHQPYDLHDTSEFQQSQVG